MVVARAPVEVLPLGAWLPLHPPEASQEVAFVELQVSVELPPGATFGGEGVSTIVDNETG